MEAKLGDSAKFAAIEDDGLQVVPGTEIRGPLSRNSSMNRPEIVNSYPETSAYNANEPKENPYYSQTPHSGYSPVPGYERSKPEIAPDTSEFQNPRAGQERRWCGLRRRWWLAILILLIVVLAAVLGGVLGTVLNNHSKS